MARGWSGTRPLGDTPSRRSAGLVLAAAAGLVALLLVGLGFAVSGLWSAAPQQPAVRGPDPAAAGPESMTQVEQQLVTRPMPAVPDQAALPHALADTDSDSGAPLTLPAPTDAGGYLVAGGFPATSEGAAAQLVALTRAGLTGGDPATYDTAYSSISEPGAPVAASSYLHQQLVELRSHSGLRPTGPVPGLTIDWTPTSALIKGSTSGGSLVVACVLGQVDVDYQGRVASAGLGDCQAMRRVDGAWRVAAGPRAATAPSAWPGSSEAVTAGYREVR